MESDQSQESFPVFHFIPRTLQDIAASKYAFISWCNSSNLSHHIPASIRSMIKDKIQSISNEIKKWIKDSRLFIGEKPPPEVMINFVAFDSAGGICSRRTVKNLLMSNVRRFDLERQFHIACSYCIEEDIERLWPSVKERFRECQFSVTDRYQYQRVDLMNYWCSRMRGELKKVYGPEQKSPEWYTLSGLLSDVEFYVRNWLEIEYFWSKLNTQEKSSLVDQIWIEQEKYHFEYESWMKQDPTKHTSRLIIMNSNDTVLRNFVRSKWFLFIVYFAIDDVYCQYALQLWNYGKSSIVEGATFSYEILLPLSKVAYKCEYSRYAAIILKEIWLSAPDHLKEYVTSDEDYDHVKNLFAACLGNAYCPHFGRDFGFLIELLKYADYGIGQKMWSNWWLTLIRLAKTSDLCELMPLCFDSVNDIVKFKKTEMLNYGLMRHSFEEFLESESFEELSEYLTFCCSDADDDKQARIVRTRIINRNLSWIIGRKPDFNLSKCFQFFDGCFTLEEVAELLECHLPDKETGLLSFWISFSCFETFERLLRCLMFSDQRLMELKRFFKERCRHVLTLGNFHLLCVDDWNNFLKWCDFSQKELSELRCSIQIDNLLENLLTNVYKFLVARRNGDDSFVAVCFEGISFHSIDGFLLWYFGSEQAVQEYKSRKRNDLENSEAMKFLKTDKMVRLLFDSWFRQDVSTYLKNDVKVKYVS
ncbi:uncharacterized protein LOC135844063 [Planococcus citri]|uniref:uncharacterized protein LOC135844063 n=1 Tax=Planococcus citri TaxID=170843 RepID=UPI0031F9761F